MQIITGRTGEPHIHAADDAELYKLFLGDGDFCLMTGNRFGINRISPTVVNILDGSLIMQGRLAKIRPSDGYDTLTLDNGTQGNKRMDLVVAEYNQQIIEKQVEQGGQIVTVEDKIESVELKIVKGTPDKTRYIEPTITTGNIDLGETHQMVLYAIKLDGIDSAPIEDRRVFLDTTPIQTAISYARGSINTIRSEMEQLESDVYKYANALRAGISQGFKGCWAQNINVELNPDIADIYIVKLKEDPDYKYRHTLRSFPRGSISVTREGEIAHRNFMLGVPSTYEGSYYDIEYDGGMNFTFTIKVAMDEVVFSFGYIENPVVIEMPSTYSYCIDDIVDVYLNGLRLTDEEYAVTGLDNRIGIGLKDNYHSFSGTVEVVATRITTE